MTNLRQPRRLAGGTLAGGLLALLSAAGGCGMVSVRVTEDFTGSPVEGAEIRCAAASGEAGKLLGRTDSMGEALVVPPAGCDALVVSKEGYETFTAQVGELRQTGEWMIEVRLVRPGRGRFEFPKTGDDDDWGFPR